MAYGDEQNRIAKLSAVAGSVLIVGLMGIALHAMGQITPSQSKGPQWITGNGSAEGGITTDDYKSPKGMQVIDQPDPRYSEAKPALPATWPGDQKVYWGRDYRKHNGDSMGLWILDATENEHRKVFRIRPAGGRTAGKISMQNSNKEDPAATVFMSSGSMINIYLPPGLYEVYAASGENWNRGISPEATVVSYGFVEVSLEQKALVIAGATDQEFRTIPRSWF